MFELFADPQGRTLQEGGNLSYDPRIFYARCWILPNRWEHSMVFLADPKFDMRQNSLDTKFLTKMLEPTNILMLVTDSTREDVESIKRSFPMYCKIKRGLIIFIIANMQDTPNALSVDEIKEITKISDVLGISAVDPNSRFLLENYFEEAVKRYFLLLAKRGQAMELVDDVEYAPPQKKMNIRLPDLGEESLDDENEEKN
jgi:hypothetical protein